MTADSYPVTEQTTATRHGDRMSYDRAAVHAVLDEAVVCHVGFVIEGKPVVLPQLHARVATSSSCTVPAAPGHCARPGARACRSASR